MAPRTLRYAHVNDGPFFTVIISNFSFVRLPYDVMTSLMFGQPTRATGRVTATQYVK